MSKIICIGIPVCNGATYLRQALDSLLAQTCSNFHAVIVDDGSTDDSYGILEQYAKHDKRITLFRNPSRTGLIATWNQVAALSGKLFDSSYFALFSDHDWVEPNWLEELCRVLDDNPATVLAHAKTIAVDASGNITGKEAYPLDTVSIKPLDTLRAVTLDIFGAGDAIYGLFRYELIRKLGFLPQEILPDRLRISEACLYGDVRHVSSTCRYRRNLSPANYSSIIVDRQLATLFAPEDEKPKAPLLQHGTYFLRRLIESPVEPETDNYARRLIHAYLYLIRQYNRFSGQWEKEYIEIQSNGNCPPYCELFSFIVDEKWIPLTKDAELRLRKFESLNRKNHERLTQARKKFSGQVASREKAETRLMESNSHCDHLRGELVAAEDRLIMQTASREEVETRLKKFKILRNELREGLANARQILSEQTLGREEAETRLMESNSHCDHLRGELVAAEDRLIMQTASREEAEARVVKLKSKCEDFRCRVEADAIDLASLHDKNTQLLLQVETLMEQVRHPFRILRQSLFGRNKK
jgi:glycosyltransferase involved in cell wall biosynthesis